ncbi:uncharacterized protein TRAVEDRAFT_89234, partial [Trametes versicolor FP-101664 SS1]|uniref:uncharacterized protein n=1 Tax=Trametes versicolor (strain FP-101664) TaxID=717944 RepID=UPI0004623BDC
ALSDFVEDTAGLRATLRLLGSVISGSFALAFLSPGYPHLSDIKDLDIYVPKDYALRFMMYLINAEGYVHMSTSRIPYGQNVAHALVITLQRAGQRIDIIPSINASPLFPISFFWASHLMNYLTADSFCAAYPEYTFAQRAVLSPVQLIDHRYPSPEIVRVIRKYEDRGYQFRVRPYA